MTLAELNTALQGLNVPVAYNVFKEPQVPPYICFLVIDYEQTYADDKNFVQNPVVRVEYYSKNKDISFKKPEKGILNFLDTPRGYFISDLVKIPQK